MQGQKRFQTVEMGTGCLGRTQKLHLGVTQQNEGNQTEAKTNTSEGHEGE